VTRVELPIEPRVARRAAVHRGDAISRRASQTGQPSMASGRATALDSAS
jgi:hypothetical protein